MKKTPPSSTASDLYFDPIVQADLLEKERNALLQVASDLHRAATAFLDAGDKFQIAVGQLSPHVGTDNTKLAGQKFLSIFQMALAADGRNFSNFINTGIVPLVEFLKAIKVDDIKQSKKDLKKNASNVKPASMEIAGRIQDISISRDIHLWKHLKGVLDGKFKYLGESKLGYEKHSEAIQEFNGKLSEAYHELKKARERKKLSGVGGMLPIDAGKKTNEKRVIFVAPKEVFFSGEGCILTVDNVILAAGGNSKSGVLTITNYRMKFETYFEINRVSNKVEKHSKLVFEIPLASISKMELMDSSNNQIVQISCKDFRQIYLSFQGSSKPAEDVVKNASSFIFADVTQAIFAFYYKDNFTSNGWDVYNAEKEFQRMNLHNSPFKKTHVNKAYQIAETYPRNLYIPAKINDSDYVESAKFRSKSRAITICWKDKHMNQVIARCSQPLVGLGIKSNDADELISRAIGEIALSDRSKKGLGVNADGSPVKPVVIFDARPKVNAIGNLAHGGGWETNLEGYNADFEFINIENIHVVRESMDALQVLFYPSEDSKQSETIDSWVDHFYTILETVSASKSSTSWVSLLQSIIEGSCKIVESIENGKSVIVHCSDGWDRTSQLTATSQLILDGYYRTIEGFACLVEKEFCMFGHKFAERSGHGKNRNKPEDKQISPIFVQWLDVVYQLVNQSPESFEFNQNLLLFLAEHLYSCRFGTFLCDNERERLYEKISTRTVSIWSYVLMNLDQFKNKKYNSSTIPRISASTEHYKLWIEYYIRWNQHLFEDPENDSKEILEKFNNKVEEHKRRISLSSSISASALISGKKISSRSEDSATNSEKMARLYERESAMIAENKYDDMDSE